MLDAFIIDELKRREQEERQSERPRIELPIDGPSQNDDGQEDDDEEEESDRGVVIINL